ncbi:MAG: hypothetical protein VB064_07680 [Oscillospiraceae bacterium]|nr:hypothetical protein [Oscillospiraceae bacterium]
MENKKPRKRNDIKGTGQNWRKGKLTYTAEQLQDKYKDYIAHCKAEPRKPTWEGYAGYIDIASETLLMWMNAKSEEDKAYNPEVVETLKKIQDSFIDNLLQRTDAMAVFSLKQPKYGGYTDKQQIEGKQDIKIHVTVGGLTDD